MPTSTCDTPSSLHPRQPTWVALAPTGHPPPTTTTHRPTVSLTWPMHQAPCPVLSNGAGAATTSSAPTTPSPVTPNGAHTHAHYQASPGAAPATSDRHSTEASHTTTHDNPIGFQDTAPVMHGRPPPLTSQDANTLHDAPPNSEDELIINLSQHTTQTTTPDTTQPHGTPSSGQHAPSPFTPNVARPLDPNATPFIPQGSSLHSYVDTATTHAHNSGTNQAHEPTPITDPPAWKQTTPLT